MARGRGARVDGDGAGVRDGGIGEARVPEIRYLAGTMGVDGDFLEEMMGVQMECERVWAEWYEKAARELEGAARSLDGEARRCEKEKRRSKRKNKKTRRANFGRLVELWKMLVLQGDDEAAAELWTMIVTDSQAIIVV